MPTPIPVTLLFTIVTMGVQRKDGYSATVGGFFAVGSQRYPLAKTNGSRFVLATPIAIPPGTEGQLVVIVDGNENSRHVVLPDGAIEGERDVNYKVVAPF